jgi:hypothetical protein
MAFNAKQYLEDCSPPVFIDADGVEHRGRLLSAPEMARFVKRFDALGTADFEELVSLVRDLCTAMNLPADKVLELPPEGAVAAVGDFLASAQRKRDSFIAQRRDELKN